MKTPAYTLFAIALLALLTGCGLTGPSKELVASVERANAALVQAYSARSDDRPTKGEDDPELVYARTLVKWLLENRRIDATAAETISNAIGSDTNGVATFAVDVDGHPEIYLPNAPSVTQTEAKKKRLVLDSMTETEAREKTESLKHDGRTLRPKYTPVAKDDLESYGDVKHRYGNPDYSGALHGGRSVLAIWGLQDGILTVRGDLIGFVNESFEPVPKQAVATESNPAK